VTKKLLGIIVAGIVVIVLWGLAATLVHKPFLPAPDAVAGALVKLYRSGTLFRHLNASFFRILLAFVCCFFPGVAFGLAAGRHPVINSIVSPVLYLFHPLPKAAFLPIIMLFLGLGELSKIFLVALIIFSQILVTARDSAKRISEELINSVRSLGAGRIAVLVYVIIPSVIPDLFTSLRVSLGTAIAVLFLAETFASTSGLGYLIIDAWTRIAYPEMYGAIAALSITGLVLFGIIDLAEWFLCPWNR
jgi:NitT/TauT family transport system permease protein